jgi:hypothetical protein
MDFFAIENEISKNCPFKRKMSQNWFISSEDDDDNTFDMYSESNTNPFKENEENSCKDLQYKFTRMAMDSIQDEFYKKNNNRDLDEGVQSFLEWMVPEDYTTIVDHIKTNKKNSYIRVFTRSQKESVRMITDVIEKKLSLKESIIAAAFHPKRLQHVLDTFGTIEAWEATVGA